MGVALQNAAKDAACRRPGRRDRHAGCANCDNLLSCILSFLLTLAVIYLDPFGLGAATDKYSKQLFYQLYAPYYDNKGQDHTSVVLVTDETVRAMGGEWPVSYTAHALMLEAILEERPAALMIDILFLDQREGLQDIKRVLRQNKENHNVPIYVAAPPTELGIEASALIDLAVNDIKFVSVELSDFYHDSQVYPTSIEQTNGHILRSAAFTIASDLCLKENKAPLCPDNLNESALSNDMEVIWGVSPPNYATLEGLTDDSGYKYIYSCTPVGNVATRSWSLLFFGRDGTRQTCYYTPTIEAHHLYNTVSKTFSTNIIQDKVIFYGSKISGVDDFILPPTHYLMPGVYSHAMAFDNIIVYGNKYISSGLLSKNLSQHVEIILAIIFTLIMFIQKRHSKGRALIPSSIAGLFAVLAYIFFAAVFSLFSFLSLNIPPVNWLAVGSVPVTITIAGALRRPSSSSHETAST